MKLFPGFLFNAPGIRLKRFDLLGITAIFLLQSIDFNPQSVVLCLLLTVHNHAVRAKHDVQEQPHGQQHNRTRGYTSKLVASVR